MNLISARRDGNAGIDKRLVLIDDVAVRNFKDCDFYHSVILAVYPRRFHIQHDIIRRLRNGFAVIDSCFLQHILFERMI